MYRLQTITKTHCYDSVLKPSDINYRKTLLNYLLEPLLADIGHGDITTDAFFSGGKRVAASIVAKQKGILAGMQELIFFLDKKWASAEQRKIFGKMKLFHSLKDGALLRKKTVIATIEGSVRDILKLERTILNFLQRMCGVATAAHNFVHKCEKFPVLVCPIRKTLWGLLDKRACVVGGAGTHRLNLGDAVLIKDTHLDLLGHNFSLLEKKLLSAEKKGRFVEIEVESIAEAWKVVEMLQRIKTALKVPCFIMLDNMDPQKIAGFMKKFRRFPEYKDIFVEASGGIDLENIYEYAKSGVDVLSVGAITHSAPALDISLKISGVY